MSSPFKISLEERVRWCAEFSLIIYRASRRPCRPLSFHGGASGVRFRMGSELVAMGEEGQCPQPREAAASSGRAAALVPVCPVTLCCSQCPGTDADLTRGTPSPGGWPGDNLHGPAAPSCERSVNGSCSVCWGQVCAWRRQQCRGRAAAKGSTGLLGPACRDSRQEPGPLIVCSHCIALQSETLAHER